MPASAASALAVSESSSTQPSCTSSGAIMRSTDAAVKLPSPSTKSKPTPAAGSRRPSPASSRNTPASSKPSASRIPSQTARSISARERLVVRSDDTRSRCSTAVRWRAASVASWACSITLAAIAATADSTSSAASLGRRPSTGSSSERKASRRPSDAVSGTSSASSGCQASGPFPVALPETQVTSRLSKSNWSCGTRYAPWRRKRSSSSLSRSAGATRRPSSAWRACSSWSSATTTS